jgi:predicted nuclease of predicted toxin-antitoxin system
MKIKLDENIPCRLVGLLSGLGHDIDTVQAEGLTGRDDNTIWHRVCEETRFFITQDLDFSDIRQYGPGTHPGLMLVRLHEPGREALLARIIDVFRTEPVKTWERCFVVVTDLKIRIYRP